MRGLHPEDLALQDVLDRPSRQQLAAGHALMAVVAAQQFVNALSGAQASAEAKAEALSRDIRDDRQREAQERGRGAFESHPTTPHELAKRKRAVNRLRREREALVARAAGADDEEREELEFQLYLLDLHLDMEQNRLHVAEDDAQREEIVDTAYAMSRAGSEEFADLLDQSYQGIIARFARTRRAAAWRRRWLRWLRKLRAVAYGMAGLLIGQALPSTPAPWAFVVALLVWIADEFLVQPRFARREADRHRLELQTELVVTAQIWIRLRSLQAGLQSETHSRDVAWEPIVPMSLFASGAAALGLPTEPDAAAAS